MRNFFTKIPAGVYPRLRSWTGMTMVTLSLFLTNSAHAEVLTLKEYIRLASQKDTVFQEILIDELKLKYKKTLGLPAEDLVLSLKSQYSFFFEDSAGEPENSVSLEKLFPMKGTLIGAEYASDVRSGIDVTSAFSIFISQPIAENAFGRNTQMLDKIIGMETEVARHQIVEAYEDYLATLIQTYYSWYSAYENLKTGENSYNENEKLLENIREREQSKIALPIDVNKITLQVLSKRENLYTLENTHTKFLNLVKNAIRHEGTDELQPENPFLYDNVNIVHPEDYEIFKLQSRTADILKKLEAKGALDVDRRADELLPSINLLGGITVQGEEHHLKDSETFAYIGFSIDLPVQRSVEKARLETSKINLEKTKLSSQSTYAGVYTTLKNLYDEIKREKKLIAIADEKIAVAQSIVEDEAKNYSLGKVTLNDFIDVVNRLEDNKFTKIFHEVQLKKLTVEWLRITDRLVFENEVLPQR